MSLIIFKKKRIVEILASLFDVDLYREQTVLSIHGGKDGAYDKTFIDSSSLSNTITVSGDTRQGVIGPVHNTGSLYFDGSSDFIQWPNSDAQTIGTGDFTIEFWLKAAPTTDGFIIGTRSAGGATFHITAGGYKGLTPAGSLRYGSTEQATTTIVFDNTWHHCAISRQSGTVRMFVDGVMERTFSDTSVVSSASGTYYIGRHDTVAGIGFLNGYLSNFRIVKEALYTGSFTVPTAPLSAVSNTTLLLNAENTNVFRNNHSFVDSSSNVLLVSRFGNVSQGSFSPFADTGGSAYFDGTSDYLTLPNQPGLVLGTGDFTVEYWVNYSSFYNYITNICSTRGSNGFNAGSQAARQIVWYANGAERVRGVTTMSQNTWHHVAFVRYNGVLKGYVNGVQDGTTYVDSINYSSPIQWIGALNDLTEAFTGSMTGIRVSKGIARYTSNFTVPASPLTSDVNTSLLLKFESAGIVDSTRNNILETIGNAQLVQNGKFDSAISLDGTSCVRAMHKDNYNFGSSDFTIEFWVKTNAAINVGSQGLCLLSKRNSIAQHAPIYIGFFGNNNTLGFAMSSNGTAWDITSNLKPWGTSLVVGEWTHLALVRSGTSITAFTNGVATQRITSSASLVSNTSYLTVGKDLDASTGLNGMIDDLRITVGKARYQSNFVPMLSEFKDVKPTDFDPYWDKVVLRMTMDGESNSTNLVDFTGKSLTNNNVLLASSVAKFGSTSAYFNGIDSHILATISLDNQNFTVEAWVYITEDKIHPLFTALNSPSDATGWHLSIFPGGILRFYTSNSNFNTIESIPLNTWAHVCAVRASNIVTLFINGVKSGSLTVTNNLSNSAFRIGISWDNLNYLAGYIDDLRITKGVARYTTNFVPPTAALPVSDAVVTDQDPYWNETVLSLSPLNTSVANYKTGALTLGTSTTITSGKFGNALTFDGTNASICSVPASADFNFGTGDFTIEAWVFITGDSAVAPNGARTAAIVSNFSSGSGGGFSFVIHSDADSTGLGVNFGIRDNSSVTVASVTGLYNIAKNTWVHVAVSRINGVINTFVSGILLNSASAPQTISATNPIKIGGRDIPTYSAFLIGKIEDLRITRGKARYTTNFTVPALPNPTTGPTF